MLIALSEILLGVFVALVLGGLLFVAGLGLFVPFLLVGLVIWIFAVGHAARTH
jgi:hypothetical protein